MAVYLWKLSLTVPPPPNLSDYANNLLYGQSILQGNPLLHGWITLRDPMWFGDLLYALGLHVRGFDPALLHIVPVVVSTSLVVLMAWCAVAALQVRADEAIMLMGVAVLPLVLPSHALAGHVLVGPNHTDTAAAALAAILALAPGAGPRHGATPMPRVILGGTLLAVGAFGDPYMLALGIVPIITFAIYHAVVRRKPLRKTAAFLPMVIALAAWGAAAGGLRLIPYLGGFTMRPSISSFITLDDLGSTLLRFIRAFLDLSGANFFGMALGAQLIVVLARLGYLCAGVWAVIAVLSDLGHGVERDWTTSVLALSACISAAGTFLYPSTSSIYQVPVFLVMSVVLARHVATAHRQWIAGLPSRRLSAALLICGLFAALPIEQFLGPQGYDDPSRYPPMALARWLEQHGLRQGYGPYGWASIITVETRGRVVVRALISTNQYRYSWLPPWRLIPNIEQMGNAAWYTEGQPGSFVIVDNAEVDRQTALQTFGPPDESYHVAGVDVLAYKSGIVCTVPQSAQARAEEAIGLPPRAALCERERTRAPSAAPIVQQ